MIEDSRHEPFVGSWEINGQDQSWCHFSLAQAYLESSHHLCKAMIDNELDNIYSYSRVILSLFYHAEELFYKGAVWRATGKKPKNSHNLNALRTEYQNLFKEDVYQLPSPFQIVNYCNDDSADAAVEEHWETLDQRYRYHMDLKGDLWPGIDGFKPDEFIIQILNSIKAFQLLIPKLLSQ